MANTLGQATGPNGGGSGLVAGAGAGIGAQSARVGGRYLQADVRDSTDDDGPPSFDPADGPWEFSGVAVGDGDRLHMDDGTPVEFTPDVLAESARTQADKPITANHPTNPDGSPSWPPKVPDEVFGKVNAARYEPGRGVVYAAHTHDPKMARGVHAGSYEVSVHPRFDVDGKTADGKALRASNVTFLDLSFVSKGDSLSNTAVFGAGEDVAASADLDVWAGEHDLFAVANAAENENETGGGGAGGSGAGAGAAATANEPMSILNEIRAVLSRTAGAGAGAGSAGEETDDDEPAEPGGGGGAGAGGGSGGADADADADESETNGNMTEKETDGETDEEQNANGANTEDGGAGADADAAVLEAIQAIGEQVEATNARIDEIQDSGVEQSAVDEKVNEAVAAAQERDEREELVAGVSEFVDDDTDPSEWPTEALRATYRAHAGGAAQIPGTGGVGGGELVAGVHGGDGSGDLDAYGTGVEGDE